LASRAKCSKERLPTIATFILVLRKLLFKDHNLSLLGSSGLLPGGRQITHLTHDRHVWRWTYSALRFCNKQNPPLVLFGCISRSLFAPYPGTILPAWLASQSIESLNSPNRVGGSNLTSPRKRNVADRSDRTRSLCLHALSIAGRRSLHRECLRGRQSQS
jgi:hypothetical protein